MIYDERHTDTVLSRAPVGYGGRFHGAYPALVQDIADPDSQGRVKVSLPWAPDSGDASYEAWARLATFMAGNDRGSWFIPDVGDEVLVVFLAGDPRHPIVIGALWNGSDAPPESMDGGGENNIKKLRSRNGVTITLDDSDGQELLHLETPGGQTLTLKDGPGQVELRDSNGNSVVMESAGITVTASAKVTVTANLVEVSASLVNVSAGMSKFSGVVQADTVIANSIIGASYTPGAGTSGEVVMTVHDVVWRSPSPVWFAQRRGLDTNGRLTLRRPAILRFERDSFMNDYLEILEADPPRLEDFVVAKEMSWQEPSAPAPAALLLEPPAQRTSIAGRTILRSRRVRARKAARNGSNGSPVPTPAPTPPKLYQPAHQRYYLVTASLVCRLPGLPDKSIDPGNSERASFVVRRLLPRVPVPTTSELPVPHAFDWQDVYEEYAFVRKKGQVGWVPLNGSAGGRVAGEDEIPLFASRYDDDDGKNRRIMGGVIPVANRETYMGAPELDPSVLNGGEDATALRARELTALGGVLRQKVIEPWMTLIELVEDAVKASVGDQLDDPLHEAPATTQDDALGRVEGTIATASWYIILDFAHYLASYSSELWGAIESGISPAPGPAAELYSYLNTVSLRNPKAPPATTTLLQALREIGGYESTLESVATPYVAGATEPDGWPAKGYLLVDPEDFWTTNIVRPFRRFVDARNGYASKIAELAELTAATQPRPANGAPAPAVPEAMREIADARDGWFVLRCAYERPNCGDIHPPTMSEPSIPFQMATFFDPEAPARPVRIQLPIDTTTAGLRRHAKNTAFVMPSALCGQIEQLRKFSFGDLVRSVLPWPFHKSLDVSEMGMCGGGDSGTVCSLSIPIVTICALIIMIMIAKLLDEIFRWFPFLITCFELPGARSKRD